MFAHLRATRAAARLAGTLVGAALATLIAVVARPCPEALAVWVVVFAWSAYLLQKEHYALFSLCLTSYIVFLLSFAGLPERTVMFYRTLNTAIGGALALLVSLT